MTGSVIMIMGVGSVSISVSPSSAEGTGNGGVVTSNSVTVSVSGGTATSFQWVKSSGGSISASSPNSSITTFFGAGFTGPETRTAVFVCNVVVNGVTYVSSDVPVTLERF